MNGNSQVPGFNGCNASIVGSTEGALYKNELTEDSVLWYWRKPLCRQVPLYFEKKLKKGPFNAYKYVLRENVYDRSENLTEDCFRGFFQLLPNGFSDVSRCFYGMSSIFLHLNNASWVSHSQFDQLLWLFPFRYAICCIKSTLLRTISESIDGKIGGFETGSTETSKLHHCWTDYGRADWSECTLSKQCHYSKFARIHRWNPSI